MRIAGVADPAACAFADDSVKNIVAAKRVGWTTILVGLTDRDTGAPVSCADADYEIASLRELARVMPDLFAPE
jgi:pyrimidine and pyridine-specific 5'-nucleotidase